MKKIFSVTPIVVAVVIFTMASVSQAERFHDKDGHEIEILWKQKGKKKFTAWGGISGGKRTCKQMNYSIRFKNSESNRSAYVDGYIKDYRPTGRNTFNGSDDIYKRSRKFAQRSAKNSWYVSGYDFNCLN